MYFLTSSSEIIKNVYTLSYPSLNSHHPSLSELSIAYRKEIQKYCSQHNYSKTPDLIFKPEEESDKEVLTLLGVCSTEHCELEYIRNVRDACNEISMIDPTFYEISKCCIDTIIVSSKNPLPGSSSVPDMLGVLWIGPGQDWTTQDLIESFVHELVHTLLFIDEKCHVHYNDVKLLSDKNTWVRSAIRNEARPVNAVVHSIIVATEIVTMRVEWNLEHTNRDQLHGSSLELIHKSLSAIQDLMSDKLSWELLSNRMKKLIYMAQETLLRHRYNFKEGKPINV